MRFSWGSCNSVVLSESQLTWDYTDEVKVDDKPPPRNKELLRGYQYTTTQDFSIDL